MRLVDINQIAQMQTLGLCADADEMEEGLSAVAAPIIDVSDCTIAAMNITFNTGAMKCQELPGGVLSELRQAVAGLTTAFFSSMPSERNITYVFVFIKYF